MTSRPSANILSALEAILLVAGDPASPAELAHALGLSPESIPGLCDLLSADMEGHGIHVAEISGRYALATRPEHADTIDIFIESRRRNK